MAKIQPSELLETLTHFTGTTQWYKNQLFPSFKFTDGVKYLADQAECYWLIDYIFSNQSIPKIKEQAFQVWKISLADNKATIQVEDGNDNIIQSFEIEFTDFPLPSFTLWFVNQVLLLPSEY